MPTTTELVASLLDFLPDYSVAKRLEYLNRAQNRLWNNDCAPHVFLNYSDPAFPIPYLSTTEDTLSYNLSSATLLDSAGSSVALTVGGYAVIPRKVKQVFVDASSFINSTNLFYGRDFMWAGINNTWQNIESSIFQKVTTILEPVNGVQGARVTFPDDPGTHTDRYYVEFYYRCPQLTAVSVPMFVDATEWEMALIDGAVGYAEMVENGESRKYDKFEKYWVPKYTGRANALHEERSPASITQRPCG